MDTWQGPPARFLRVSPAPTSPDSVDELVDAALSAWFTRHDVGLVVLRPDRFVYATSTTDVAAPLPLRPHRTTPAGLRRRSGR